MIARWFWVSLALAAVAAADPSKCAPCHAAQTQAFGTSAMTQALTTTQDSSLLRTNPGLKTKIGPYSYEIADSALTVTDGKETFRAPILWAFGHGKVGQTYLYQLNGRWYESRVSYFPALSGLDVTMGQQNLVPHNIEEAAGRLMGPAETAQCFGCHATNVGKSQPPDLAKMTAGVQCERCHGEPAAHLQSVRTGASGGAMKKLGAYSSEEMLDFCGQCHRTWSQVAANGPRGIQNIRFQPYRLAGSKCYDAADSRIACTTCHDPHRPLETSAAVYDSKCTACHSASIRQAGGAARTCRVASKDCVTCHMPRLDLPGAHQLFTDHRIRIARPGEPYPD
jgi:hypothetical protein